MKINIIILIVAQTAFFGCKEEAATQAEGEHNKSLTTLSETNATPVGQWNWKSTCGGFAPGCEYASETVHRKIEFTGTLFTGLVGGTDYKNISYTIDSTQADPTPTYFMTLENGAHWQVSLQGQTLKIQLGELTEEYALVP